MKSYAAFLRGVSPMNARMPDLARAFEAAGFSEVRTVLSSGNVVFRAPAAATRALERRAEAAMERRLGSAFPTLVRSIEALGALLASDPWAAFHLAPGSKRVVTFLRERPRASLALPVELEGARILRVEGREVLTAYVPSPRGAAFMALIERTFGREVTTRTWETVAKVVRAAPAGAGEPAGRRANAISGGGRRRRPSRRGAPAAPARRGR
jgi:uncharacterized protein (DUF1697 family)